MIPYIPTDEEAYNRTVGNARIVWPEDAFDRIKKARTEEKRERKQKMKRLRKILAHYLLALSYGMICLWYLGVPYYKAILLATWPWIVALLVMDLWKGCKQ